MFFLDSYHLFCICLSLFSQLSSSLVCSSASPLSVFALLFLQLLALPLSFSKTPQPSPRFFFSWEPEKLKLYRKIQNQKLAENFSILFLYFSVQISLRRYWFLCTFLYFSIRQVFLLARLIVPPMSPLCPLRVPLVQIQKLEEEPLVLYPSEFF